nr:hypothetical protein [Tanacetum cinerariifolium]
MDDSSNSYEEDQIPQLFLKHFKAFLRTSQPVQDIENCENLFQRRISEEDAQRMVADITDAKIKSALFNIDDSKALSPDGFTSTFFKKYGRLLEMMYAKQLRNFFFLGKCWESLMLL